MSQEFKIESQFKPAGDQPNAINKLIEGLSDGLSHQTLLGVTGSGKTFTIANVIKETARPTIILAPNKTLAAQLYGEMKEVFSAQRCRVLCFLLRLLPARSLCTEQ